MPTKPPAPPSAFTRAAAEALLDEALRNERLPVADPYYPDMINHLPEVQNAIWAALATTDNSLYVASITNKLFRVSEGKSSKGRWPSPAVDVLRSALVFASAGLDTSLKRLVKHALPMLVDADEVVEAQFQKWAAAKMSAENGGIDPKSLVRVLMTRGASPRDSLMNSWIYELTDGSAQSADRVDALCTALGVTGSDIRKRTSPKSTQTVLKAAFAARNEIAHELDVTDPVAETRQRLEHVRRYRSRDEVKAWCIELLDVTQLIANDVAGRLSNAAGA
ncbi:MAG: hypothetical protein NVV70_18020 [Cellulomonas sp.]|nr:hypothetical protein [Cellulomonas sp.]MCR6649936.1 hypothetical protein [Cellulomonas sp.]